ncbi:MAG: folate-binding protein [Ahrensia sp.]|nr:folate-binding protein [Ahrensia sp.]
MVQSALLSSRALVRIAGTEAPHFLQNLVTCEVESMTDGSTAFGALLTPQGKILFDFLLKRVEDEFVVDLNAEQVDDFVKRMMFYRLRAKVEIEKLDHVPTVTWPAEGGDADARDARLGMRGYATDVTTSTETEWQTLRIALGYPESGRDFEPSSTFPHEALMDQFGHSGVDFTKGCYVGQEVVSRMQHRGTARSRFVKIRAVNGDALPAVGTAIVAGDRAIGSMGSSVGSEGLGLLRLDRTAKAMAEGTALHAGDTVVTATLPDFATFDWPQ